MCANGNCACHNILAKYDGHMSSLIDALSPGTNEQWEYSEPLTYGGAAGVYDIKAPFTGDCEYSIQLATAGSSPATMSISSSIKRSSFDLTGAISFSGNSGFDGSVVAAPTNQTVPTTTQFFQMRNSENTLYLNVSTSAGSSGFITIVFRQKRVVK